MTSPVEIALASASDACTLPTAERPVRLAEFDDVFRDRTRSVTRPGPGSARLDLEPSPETAATVAGLVVRETRCCSFFTFTLTATGGVTTLEITAPPERAEIVDAFAARAEALAADSRDG